MDTPMSTAAAEVASGLVGGLSESPAINELATALAKAQGAFSNPAKDRKNPYFSSRYTILGAVIEVTRGPLADNGLSLTQTVGGRPPLLRTRLLHASGQWIASKMPLFAAGKGSQVFGSELTYMRRYAMCALLNIASAEGDDDGNAAQAAANAAADASQAPRHARSGTPAHSPARPQAQAARPGPTDAVRQKQQAPLPPGSFSPPDVVPPEAVTPQQAQNALRRHKDEPSPPSVWGILRPGKAGITAPDGAAWLNWWTGIASKAAAEGKRGWLRALYDANTVAWDEIALGSAEGHDAVAQAGQAVRTALGD